MQSSKKVNVTLMGGLGNQLFQYAFSLYVELITNQRVIFNDLNKSMRRNNANLPEIAGFTISANFDSQDQGWLEKFLGKWLGLLTRLTLSKNQFTRNKVFHILVRWICSLLASLKYKQRTTVFISPEIGFTNWISKNLNELCLGYFQTHRFADHPEVRQKLLSLRPVDYEAEIRKYRDLSRVERPLLVHIRLGDYKNEPDFGLISPTYYFNAVREQMQKVIHNKIWVFSDEISEFEKYIPPEYLDHVRLIPEVGSSTCSLLEVMRMCEGYVIANSTLSWWAAYLSHNQDSFVCYPKPWFAAITEPSELFPSNWVSRPR